MPVEIFAFSFSEVLEAWPVILALILIEGLLSVDNALAIAAMANHLPGKQKILALRLGIIGAYAFRGLALWLAAWITDNHWVMWCGAAYLVYLMCAHFTSGGDKDEEGVPDAVPARGFFATIMAIEVMDLSLSVDNVVAAAAMDRRIWVICTGVFIGILALRFVAGWCIKLLEKYPILEDTAFLLIGFVGFLLVGELTWEVFTGYKPHVAAWQKFIGIVLILSLAIWYSKNPRVEAALKPLIKAAQVPMKGVAVLVGGVLNVVLYPFKLLFGLFRKPAQNPTPPAS